MLSYFISYICCTGYTEIELNANDIIYLDNKTTFCVDVTMNRVQANPTFTYNNTGYSYVGTYKLFADTVLNAKDTGECRILKDVSVEMITTKFKVIDFLESATEYKVGTVQNNQIQTLQNFTNNTLVEFEEGSYKVGSQNYRELFYIRNNGHSVKFTLMNYGKNKFRLLSNVKAYLKTKEFVVKEKKKVKTTLTQIFMYVLTAIGVLLVLGCAVTFIWMQATRDDKAHDKGEVE